MRVSRIASLFAVALAATAACSSESAMDPADAAPSRAFGIWPASDANKRLSPMLNLSRSPSF